MYTLSSVFHKPKNKVYEYRLCHLHYFILCQFTFCLAVLVGLSIYVWMSTQRKLIGQLKTNHCHASWSYFTSVCWSHLYSWQTFWVSHVTGNLTNIYLSFKSGLIWQIFWKICFQKINLSFQKINLSFQKINSFFTTHKFVTSKINLSHFFRKYRFVMQQN